MDATATLSICMGKAGCGLGTSVDRDMSECKAMDGLAISTVWTCLDLAQFPPKGQRKPGIDSLDLSDGVSMNPALGEHIKLPRRSGEVDSQACFGSCTVFQPSQARPRRDRPFADHAAVD
jgi:hypothetical protein